VYGEKLCQEQEFLNGVNGWRWIWQPTWKSDNIDSAKDDGKIIVRMTAEELNINRETERLILTDNLRMKKDCAKMMPKNLTND
jgi:hypothetical protein